MKQPWFKFYPADWRSDKALRMCSPAARGLWMDMLCIMHEAVPYGSLTVNGTKIDERSLGHLSNIDVRSVKHLLNELEKFGVFDRDESGVIFSRRMKRDYERSQIYRANGSQGGNPKLLNQTDKPQPSKLDNHLDKPSRARVLEARSYIEEKEKTYKKESADSRRARSEPKRQLPVEFAIPDEEFAKLIQAGHSAAKIQSELEHFKDHARANGRLCKDWLAAFRNWMRSPYQTKGNGNGHGRLDEQATSVVEAGKRILARLGSGQPSFSGIDPGSDAPVFTIPQNRRIGS